MVSFHLWCPQHFSYSNLNVIDGTFLSLLPVQHFSSPSAVNTTSNVSLKSSQPCLWDLSCSGMWPYIGLVVSDFSKARSPIMFSTKYRVFGLWRRRWQVRDRIRPPLLNWNFPSFGVSHGARWFETDVSRLPFSSLSMTLEDGTHK